VKVDGEDRQAKESMRKGPEVSETFKGIKSSLGSPSKDERNS
jgi:hypothetical protein